MGLLSTQLDRLNRRMKAIPQAVRQAVAPALDLSANELVGRMRALAPVDRGDLRDSIEAKPGDHELQRKVATDDFKARWVEFGTVDQPPSPFFWPAYRLSKKRIAGRLKRAVSKAVRQNWGT